jgi:hypothetical protein
MRPVKADLATFYDSAVEPVSVSHSYRWLPPRVDGLRSMGLQSGDCWGTGEIPPENPRNLCVPARAAAESILRHAP